MVDAGTATFKAVADFQSVVDESRRASDALGGVQSATEGVGPASQQTARSWQQNMASMAQQTGQVGRSMTLGITAPLTLMGTVATRTFTDFDTLITQAGLKADATEAEMAEMRDTAIELGASTIFSAREAAAGMDELAAAGFSARDAIDTLPAVMLAAQAANEDLGLTAATVSQAMNAFGLETADATHVADVFSQAANTTALDMQGLAEALAQAGQLGASANQGLEDVVATVGLLVNQGVPAASAGAAIRQAVTSLQQPLAGAASLMSELGIAVRDANGEMLPLPDLVNNLDSALSDANPAFVEFAASQGLSANAARDQALNTLFGVEGMKAMALAMNEANPLIIDMATETDKMSALAAGLAETMGKDAADAFIAAHTEGGKFVATGGDAIRALSAMGTASDGLSEKFGEAFSETLGAKMDEFGGALESLYITLVTAVLPAFTAIVEKLTDFFEWVGRFAEANPGIAQFVIGLLAVLAVIGPLLIMVSKVITAARIIGSVFVTASGQATRLGTAFLSLGRWIGSAVTWMGRFVVSAARMVAQGFMAIVRGAGQAVAAIGRFIVSMTRAAASAAASAARTAAAWAAAAVRSIASFVSMGAAAAASAARTAAVWVATTARTIAALAAQAAAFVAQKAVMVAQAAITGVVTAAQWLLNAAMMANPIGLIILAIVALVGAFIWLWNNVDGFRAFFEAVWQGIQTAVQAVVSWFTDTVVPFFEQIWGAIVAGLQWVGNLFSTVWNGILTVVTNVINWIRNVVMTVWNGIRAYFTFVFNLIRTLFTTALNIWRTIVTTVFNAIRNVVETVWNAIVGVVQWAVNLVMSIINGIGSIVQNVIGFFTRIKDGIVEKFTEAVDWVRGIPGRILDALGNIGSTLLDSGRALIDGFLDGIKGAWDNVTGWIGDALSTVRSWFPFSPAKVGPFSGRGWVLYSGMSISEAFAEGMEARQDLVVDATSSLVGAASIDVNGPMLDGLGQVGVEPVPGNPLDPRFFAGGGGAGGVTIANLTVNNPKPERVGDSLSRTIRKVTSIGVAA